MQGDPLSMFLYAVGTLPLIQSLKGVGSCAQIWYADDASACGSLSDLRQWSELLLSKGPDFGYVVNPASVVWLFMILIGVMLKSYFLH